MTVLDSRVWPYLGGGGKAPACTDGARQAAARVPARAVPAEASEWTSWFNVDHPGGDGDFESLAAIRFYYGPARVCPRPLALEARTTDWALPSTVGERVHLNPTRGFWCLNREQPRGRRCSNYHVRFRCPLGEGGARGGACGWAGPARGLEVNHAEERVGIGRDGQRWAEPDWAVLEAGSGPCGWGRGWKEAGSGRRAGSRRDRRGAALWEGGWRQ